MSRTKRRTKWVPTWVIQDFVTIDPVNPLSASVWIYKSKADRIAAINVWQQDKRHFYVPHVPKLLRKAYQHSYRQSAKQKLNHWQRNPDFEVQPESNRSDLYMFCW